MWETIFDSAIGNGLWAALFVALMIYILRDTAKRERKYEEIIKNNQDAIIKLSDNLRIVGEIQQQTSEVAKDIHEIKVRQKNYKRTSEENG